MAVNWLLCLLLTVSLSGSSAQTTGKTTCNCGWTNKGRIVGGKEAGKNQYPLVAALVFDNGEPGCGGTIITPWHVITAAHCVDGVKTSDFFINVGAHNVKVGKQTLIPIEKIYIHKGWSFKTGLNDIAILKTKSEIKFGKDVGPACLPNGRLNLVGKKIRALGWGDVKQDGDGSDFLREVDLQVISGEECVRKWEGRSLKPNPQTQLCTFELNKDTCQGDSGGPMIWLDPSSGRYTLAAIVSYGEGCATKYPGVGTNVSAYLDWIKSIIAQSKPGASACYKVR